MPGRRSPPPHTPLAALPVLVIDLETTGLDVRRDRIVQVATIAMHGGNREDGQGLNQIIDPGIPIPEAAARVHGLRAADVAGAPTFGELVEALRDALSGRVIVGHHVSFDLAVLRHEASRAGIEWREPPSLDLATLVGALDPSLLDIGLETVAARLGVDIQDRHSAMGDCLAAAEAYARVLPLLRDRDIRTLGEAQAFAATRADLAVRQSEAGWHATPDEAAGPAPSMPALLLDGYAFQRRVEQVMSAPAAFITAQASARDAARRMVD